jgi:hypothetical protein
MTVAAATTAAAAAVSTKGNSWVDLRALSLANVVGEALDGEVKRREQGEGSAHVDNRLRQFRLSDGQEEPQITLYRDHAGW